jgi:hypothetical protein
MKPFSTFLDLLGKIEDPRRAEGNRTHRDLIIALAAHHRVPTIYFNRYFAESGDLIAYGGDPARLSI